MRRTGLKIAEAETADLDDRAAMSVALDRLYGAAVQNVSDIVAHLTPSERARLAVFCYGRAHLNAIGLAIAATCLVGVSFGLPLFLYQRQVHLDKAVH